MDGEIIIHNNTIAATMVGEKIMVGVQIIMDGVIMEVGVIMAGDIKQKRYNQRKSLKILK